MVKVCDMIPGGGKSSAAITYMREHPEKKFLYVTPYNPETERIRDALPELRFRLPDARVDRKSHHKREHLKGLLRYGENVAMTHVLYGLSDDETIQLIHEGGYTVIIDESINVLDSLGVKADDVKMAMNSEFFDTVDENGQLRLVEAIGPEYNGKWLSDMKLYAKSHRLFYVKDENQDQLYVWRFNKAILDASEEVFILTYLFKASTTYYMFQEEGIPYQIIGVVRDKSGTYRFSETGCWVPPYTLSLWEKIHVLNNADMNYIGNRETAFSISWQKEGSRHKMRNGRAYKVKNHLSNFFNNIHRGSSPDERLWTAFNKPKGNKLGSFAADVAGKGYASRFLVFNQRARTSTARQSTSLTA